VQPQLLEVIGKPCEGVGVLRSRGGLSAAAVVVEDEGEVLTQISEIAENGVAHIARPSVAHQEGRTCPDCLETDLHPVRGQKSRHQTLIPAERDRAWGSGRWSVSNHVDANGHTTRSFYKEYGFPPDSGVRDGAAFGSERRTV
jgi:hypothetical protein